jgi:hypothetical protein
VFKKRWDCLSRSNFPRADGTTFKPNIEEECQRSLGPLLAEVGWDNLQVSLMADTAPSFRVLTWLLKRCGTRENRGDAEAQTLEGVNDDEIAEIVDGFSYLRMLEPPRWRDARVWWPDAPLTDEELSEIEDSKNVAG